MLGGGGRGQDKAETIGMEDERETAKGGALRCPRFHASACSESCSRCNAGLVSAHPLVPNRVPAWRREQENKKKEKDKNRNGMLLLDKLMTQIEKNEIHFTPFENSTN